MSAFALMGLGMLALKRADFASAQKDYEQALALRRELGEKDGIAQTQVALSEFLMEDGRGSDSEAVLRAARDHFHEVGLKDDEIWATAVLTRGLLAENKTEEAEREVTRTAINASKCQNLAVKLDYEIISAQTELARGRNAIARQQLGSALARAKKAGLLGQQFEARLVLGRFPQKNGALRSASSELQGLAANATDKGFLLLAKKAAKNADP